MTLPSSPPTCCPVPRGYGGGGGAVCGHGTLSTVKWRRSSKKGGWWCRKLTFTKSWLGNILSGKFHLSAPSAAWFYEGNGRQDPATSCCLVSGQVPRTAASLISNIATIHWSWPEGLEVMKAQVILTVSHPWCLASSGVTVVYGSGSVKGAAQQAEEVYITAWPR